MNLSECPTCEVQLDDHDTEVRCWKCGWTLHTTTDPIGYQDRSDAIREATR
ncbi:hypothetical protein [Nocardia fluminea]|uniref:hypothetical protein n=1 Tax=Nocardia fluminea TaxID=134984 RepID=UPI0036512324